MNKIFPSLSFACVPGLHNDTIGNNISKQRTNERVYIASELASLSVTELIYIFFFRYELWIIANKFVTNNYPHYYCKCSLLTIGEGPGYAIAMRAGKG